MPATSRTSTDPPSLDDWLSDHHVRIRYSRTAAVPPARLWEAALEVRVREARTLRPIIAMRLGRHAPAPDATFREVFSSPPFVLLDEGGDPASGAGVASVSGMAGRLWSLGADFVPFEDAAAFARWSQPGFAKVVLAHRVEPHADGARIVSEARVWCTSRGAQLRFRPFWAVVGPFSRFIRAEPLAAAVRRARGT